MKKGLIAFLVVLGVVGIFVAMKYGTSSAPKTPLVTYFAYDANELAAIKTLNSDMRVTTIGLDKWQQKAFDLVGDTKTGDVVSSKFYAALFTAQRDFAYLSYNVNGEFTGTIDPVSKAVACLFFPEPCAKLSGDTDLYSERLTQVVVEKLKTRLANDEPHPELYPPKIGKTYWKSADPYIGYGTGGQRTWLIKSGDQFRTAPPPEAGSPEDDEALREVKTKLDQITLSERTAVVFWAGGPGTKTPPGQWIEITGNLLDQKHASVKDALYVRSVVAMTIADAVIAVFDSKYTYWRLRPFMRDKSIVTIMPTPNHPSYPAGHGTISGAALTVLTHFFPEDMASLQARAQEAADCRFWGGIHFDLDNQVGLTLGGNVANYALTQIAHQQ